MPLTIGRCGMATTGTFRCDQLEENALVEVIDGAATYEDRIWYDRDYGGVYEGDGSSNSAAITLDGPISLSGNMPENPGTITYSPSIGAKIYQLELRTDSGTLLYDLTEKFVVGGKVRIRIDTASDLNITITGTDESASSFVRPNVIYMRDRWRLLVDIFVIQTVTKRREGDAIFIDIFAQSKMIQLQREPVISYDTGYDADGVPVKKKIGDIVNDLLDMQVQSSKINAGRIDRRIRDYETSASFTDTSIQGALLFLRETLPLDLVGFIFVSPSGALGWTVSVGPRRRTILDPTNAISSLQYEVHWDELITRLYGYGEGDDPLTRLKLTDAGEDNEYVEGSTVGTYGIITAPAFVNKNIRHPDTLLDAVNLILDRSAEPRIIIQISALDLAKSEDGRFDSTDDLYIGREYNLVDSDQSINTFVKIVAITFNLNNPLNPQIEIDNRSKTLADFIATMQAQIRAPLSVNDDGTRYPNISRHYDGTETSTTHPALVHRAGDIRNIPGTNIWEYYDALQSRWIRLIPSFTEVNLAALPNDSDIPSNAQARTDDGENYVRNTANDGWKSAGQDAGTGILQPGSVAADGTSDDYARVDHQHPGPNYYEATTKANLNNTSINPNAIAYTTGDHVHWIRNVVNTNWDELAVRWKEWNP